MANDNLKRAKNAKNDEFYTQWAAGSVHYNARTIIYVIYHKEQD